MTDKHDNTCDKCSKVFFESKTESQLYGTLCADCAKHATMNTWPAETCCDTSPPAELTQITDSLEEIAHKKAQIYCDNIKIRQFDPSGDEILNKWITERIMQAYKNAYLQAITDFRFREAREVLKSEKTKKNEAPPWPQELDHLYPRYKCGLCGHLYHMPWVFCGCKRDGQTAPIPSR